MIVRRINPTEPATLRLDCFKSHTLYRLSSRPAVRIVFEDATHDLDLHPGSSLVRLLDKIVVIKIMFLCLITHASGILRPTFEGSKAVFPAKRCLGYAGSNQLKYPTLIAWPFGSDDQKTSLEDFNIPS